MRNLENKKNIFISPSEIEETIDEYPNPIKDLACYLCGKEGDIIVEMVFHDPERRKLIDYKVSCAKCLFSMLSKR